MNKAQMRLLDLFSGAGGAAVGYHRAGFEVVGVDHLPQKHYPFEFHEADAFDYLRDHGQEFDVIHASPPCQPYCSLNRMWNRKYHPLTIDYVRESLRKLKKPYVIENVPGAPLIHPLVILRGTMFSLRSKSGAELWRHRIFESNITLGLTPNCIHRAFADSVIGVYGGHGRDRRRTLTVTGHSGGIRKRDGTQQYTVQERKEAMGIDWMTGGELSQAIPPAYTFWIGTQLMKALA